jgi:N-acetyl-alpha-D-glucosaminyl L-malate synthase BshA
MVTLRIGLLCHRGVGGSARIAVDLGNALAGRGHEVHLFARTIPLGIASFAPGLSFHPLREDDGHAPPSAGLDAAWSRRERDALVTRVASVARSHGLDVLHFHYAVPFAWVARDVRRRLGASSPPLVGTLHGTDVSVHGRTRNGPSLARALADVDALTTVSQSHIRLAMRTFSLPTPPVLIPNFVDLTRFRPSRRNSRQRTPRPRIVHVSNFRPIKDPEGVARVFAMVRKQTDAELWLVGDGEAMPGVREIVRRAGLEGHVRFFGLHPAVETVLPHADILLLTSRTESFCLAALEAAACGVPAVAPRTGGLPEVVADGRTGLLFDPGDEASAAGAVLRILGDPQARAALRTGAVRRARRFSSEVLVPRYESLYRELLRAG